MAKKANTANFVEFYLMWGLVNGWQIPDFHITVCEWLEDFGNLGLLMLPRGHAKSTILDVYNAYRLYKNALCTRQISQNPYPIRILPS